MQRSTSPGKPLVDFFLTLDLHPPVSQPQKEEETARLVHDAGNLLTALRLYADIMLTPGVSVERYRRYAGELKLLSERSSALIERLAYEFRPQLAPIEPIILSEVLRSYMGLMGKAINRELHWDFGSNADWPVLASHEIVERVLLNLLKNAAKASDEIGQITVCVKGSPVRDHLGRYSVTISVQDEGAGMNPATLEALRRNDLPRKSDGHGLGLRIVHDLVERSGGQIEFNSSPGHGTCVSVTWFSLEST